KRLIEIVRARAQSRPAPVVVVSALARVTDALVHVTRLAEEGESRRAGDELRALVDRHVAVAAAVTTERRAAVTAEVRCEFDELIALVHALAVLREVSPRSLDAVLAVGEVVSSRIVAGALADHRVPAEWVDARNVLVTDAQHNAASPDTVGTDERVRERVAPIV